MLSAGWRIDRGHCQQRLLLETGINWVKFAGLLDYAGYSQSND
jgi:hypothetical protein